MRSGDTVGAWALFRGFFDGWSPFVAHDGGTPEVYQDEGTYGAEHARLPVTGDGEERRHGGEYGHAEYGEDKEPSRWIHEGLHETNVPMPTSRLTKAARRGARTFHKSRATRSTSRSRLESGADAERPADDLVVFLGLEEGRLTVEIVAVEDAGERTDALRHLTEVGVGHLREHRTAAHQELSRIDGDRAVVHGRRFERVVQLAHRVADLRVQGHPVHAFSSGWMWFGRGEIYRALSIPSILQNKDRTRE